MESQFTGLEQSWKRYSVDRLKIQWDMIDLYAIPDEAELDIV